jgi:hypothetical protein
MIFTMCPTTLYASSKGTDSTAAPEITEPEPDDAQDEVIVDETESITDEFIDEATYVVFAERIIPLLKIPINTGKTLNYKCISGKIDAGFYAFRHQISCI